MLNRSSALLATLLAIVTAHGFVYGAQEKTKSHKTEEKPLKGTGTGVTVGATLTRERYSSGSGPGSVSSPAWKVTLVIQNRTASELQLGDSLIVIEKVKDTGLYVGSYINRASASAAAADDAPGRWDFSGSERFKLRYGLDFGYDIDRSGSYLMVFAGGGQISISSGHIDPYEGYGYGRVSPQTERTIMVQLPFPFGAKEGLREYVAVIAPPVHSRGSGPAVGRRHLFRFAVGNEPKTDDVFQPSDAQSVRIVTADLTAQATETKLELWQRIFALNWLAETDSKAAEPLLIETATNTKNVDLLRNVASVNLGTLKAKAAVQPLVAILKEGVSTSVQRWAIDALGDIGNPEAAPAIRAFLEDADQSVAQAAMEAAGELKDAAAVPRLVAILRNDKHEKRHGSAGTALAAVGNADAVQGLAALLRDPQSKVRKLAAEKLGKTVSVQAVAPLVEVTADARAPSDVLHAAVSSLGELGGAEALAALRRAAENDKDDTRRTALAAFGATKDAGGVAALIELAERAAYPSREKAVEVLGSRKKTEALPSLRRIVANAQAPSKVRQQACEALESMKDAQGIPSLLIAANDADGDLYVKALRALGTVGGKETVSAAITALGSRHASVRERASYQLRTSKSLEAVVPLWRAYQSESEESPGRDIVSALVELGFADPAATAILVTRLDPSKNKLWSSDVHLLKHLGGTEAIAALRRAAEGNHERLRSEAIEALAATKDPGGVATLIELAGQAGFAHREAVLRTLNWRQKTEALPALRRIVADAQAPSKVRQEACQALGNMKDAQGVSALLAAAGDADAELYVSALRALNSIGGKEIVAPAVTALSSRHPSVRERGADSLRASKSPEALVPLWRAYQTETEESPGRDMVTALVELHFADPGAAAFLVARLDPAKNKLWNSDVRLLQHLGGAEAMAALRRAAEGNNERLRSQAIEALADAKDPGGVAALIALAETTGFAHREAVVQRLNWRKKTEALPALRRIVADVQAPSKIRQEAGHALGNMKDAQGVSALQAAASDADAALYVVALQALDSIGGSEVVAPAVTALSSRHASVRGRGAAVLRSHKSADALNPLWQAYQREADESPSEEMASALIELKFTDTAAPAFLIARLDPKKNKLWFQDVRLLRHLTGQTHGPEYKFAQDKERDAELSKWRDWWARKP